MSSLDEKRIYGERRGAATVYVACDLGIVTVSVAADDVGEFGVSHRCTARDVAARSGRLAVATDEGVLVGSDLEPAGFGPAVAVGFDGDALLVADADGQVARETDGGWATVGHAATAVHALYGSFVGTEDGLRRITPDGLTPTGPDAAVRGLAADLAATDAGLYEFREGQWERVHDGEFPDVAADDDCALAAGTTTLRRRAGDWTDADAPAVPSAVAVGEADYAVTADGQFLVDVGDGWRVRQLGLSGVSAVAAP